MEVEVEKGMTYAIIAILAVGCIISYFFVPVWMFAVFIVLWLAWSIFALFIMKRTDTEETSSVFSKMRKSDRGHCFTNYINGFVKQQDWLDDRMEILKDFSESYASLAEDLKNAMQGNFEKANNYMKACDYHDTDSRRKYRSKIDALDQDNEMLVNKINDLIEQLAEIENTADEVNTERVDDIIASLKEITNERSSYE